MDKLLILLMVILFAVGVTSQTIFKDGGLQKDAVDMKDNTQKMIKDTNTQMNNEFGGTTTTTP